MTRMSGFDPVVVGRLETDAWVAYYRREWRRFLVAAVGLVRAGFRMGRMSTLVGAWSVLRANQAWAPVPDNDPDAARRHMRRFYRLLARSGWSDLDPHRAAELELRWWAAHRDHQHGRDCDDKVLVDSLVGLYSYVYHADPADVLPAARHRVAAMDLSDQWVAAGRRLTDPRLPQERLELVASYTALREATERMDLGPGRRSVSSPARRDVGLGLDQPTA